MEDDDPTDKDTPRTLIELRMCALSAAIREKPEWWVKFRDEDVQASGEMRSRNSSRICVAVYSSQQHADLISAIAPLESVPDSKKDWHPGSDGKVLDLVHPSLYPVVYGRTTARGAQEPLQPRATDIIPMYRSERFQWLPSEFRVQEDGSVHLVSPYINNIHPEDHEALTAMIPEMLEKAVPLFERVLSDLARETQLPTRLDLQGHKFPQCVWPEGPETEPEMDPEISSRNYRIYRQLLAEDRRHWEAEKAQFLEEAHVTWLANRSSDSEDEQWQEPPFPPYVHVPYLRMWQEEFLDNAPVEHRWPESKPSYTDGLNCVKKTVDLRGQTLQVIVKLANIVLTPEKPEYGGGTWHVEGMDNETIVSTFIYYYDTENITESTLSFRNAVNEPRYHGQWDRYCMRRLYDISANELCAQNVGCVTTKQDRCIAFPNLYQHLVSPFRLTDPAKPGHRKILVFFLVDPNITIPSASTVSPQQEPWIRRAVEGSELWWRLPNEVHEMIWERLDPITEGQARKYREELMKERTLTVKPADEQRFGRTFNLWCVGFCPQRDMYAPPF
ncbi:uncharacterized protein B0H18DRAFT_1125496 [Fomitopsis serialis]|uniref:uncharacterized protein n=1 Tax=Fomitopsis serialis TaxID=139415 RepID=UPI0020074124|nr:uncharacterized protein B0H18DRAFT_1125496 [Neoantrodia serialis]KAH9914457.1 hypothetical protein B0H18DRAFT_1125496 [Neoantrodia serialis]